MVHRIEYQREENDRHRDLEINKGLSSSPQLNTDQGMGIRSSKAGEETAQVEWTAMSSTLMGMGGRSYSIQP